MEFLTGVARVRSCLKQIEFWVPKAKTNTRTPPRRSSKQTIIFRFNGRLRNNAVEVNVPNMCHLSRPKRKKFVCWKFHELSETLRYAVVAAHVPFETYTCTEKREIRNWS